MTRPLAPLYLAAGMVSGLWLAPSPEPAGRQSVKWPPKAEVVRTREPTWSSASRQDIGGAEIGNLPPPAGEQEGGILSGGVSDQYGNSRKEPARPSAMPPLLSDLDALDARIAALAYPDPRHCDDACLTGVERVELRRGVVSCRCRKLPSLGVHKIPEVK